MKIANSKTNLRMSPRKARTNKMSTNYLKTGNWKRLDRLD